MTHPGDEVLLAFTRALRSAGVGVTHDRATTFLDAASRVGADHARSTYLAGRCTLCSGPEDLDRYEQVFEAWFGSYEDLPRNVPRETPRELASKLPLSDEDGGAGEGSQESVQAVASEVEVLRHRDVADLTAAEKASLDLLLGTLVPRAPLRRASRRTSWRRGDVDLHTTLRRTLRQAGEPARVAFHHRATQPRRVVLLVDVSASMRPYADAILRLCQRVATRLPGTEVFTLGTRLTRVTSAMRLRDPERALVRAGSEVPDWSGGTRLGETLHAFNDRWGARGTARGAVAVVFSDGWERGDAVELGEQAQRLHRLCHRLVWVNPHRGKAGYQPLQRGIMEVLPHVDSFIAGHSLAAYEQVLEVVASA